jgi:hypothetical protein
MDSGPHVRTPTPTPQLPPTPPTLQNTPQPDKATDSAAPVAMARMKETGKTRQCDFMKGLRERR